MRQVERHGHAWDRTISVAEQRLLCFSKQHIKEDTTLQSDKNILLRIDCACNQKGFISTSLFKHFFHLHATFSSSFCDWVWSIHFMIISAGLQFSLLYSMKMFALFIQMPSTDSVGVGTSQRQTRLFTPHSAALQFSYRLT